MSLKGAYLDKYGAFISSLDHLIVKNYCKEPPRGVTVYFYQ